MLGAWIFVAPWVLGFTGLVRASWDHWIVGALIFLLALWSLRMARGTPASVDTASRVNPPPRTTRPQ